MEIWNRAGNFDPAKGKLLGWLITFARRRAIDRIRRRIAYSRAEERLRLEKENECEQSYQHGADVAASDSDRAEIFQRIIATLPQSQREALKLSFHGGLSQREIAARTGIPLGTIKTRLELGL